MPVIEDVPAGLLAFKRADAIRLAKGISERQFSLSYGYSANMWHEMRKRGWMPWELIDRIAEREGVPKSYFLMSDKEAISIIGEDVITAERIAALEEVRKLGRLAAKQREELRRTMRPVRKVDTSGAFALKLLPVFGRVAEGGRVDYTVVEEAIPVSTRLIAADLFALPLDAPIEDLSAMDGDLLVCRKGIEPMPGDWVIYEREDGAWLGRYDGTVIRKSVLAVVLELHPRPQSLREE